MKFFNLLFITFLICIIAGCAQQAQPEEAPENTDGPIQWVTYKGNKDQHIVLVSGDEEYRSEEALPQLGKILSRHHGFTCTVLFAQDPANPGIIDPNYLNNIPGLEKLQDADLMIIFTRFRELPDDQMSYIQEYLMAGKPVIGIRTSTHAFNVKDSASKWLHYDNFYQGDIEAWDGGFGRLVLGERWVNHHGHHKHQSTRGIIAAKDHPVTTGIADGDIWGPTDVYGVRLPLPGDSEPIVLGQVINRKGEFDDTDPDFGMRPTDDEVATINPQRKEHGNPNDPMMPVAWTKSYQLPGGQTGRSFASTIGSATDMKSEGVRRMFVNATYWLLGLEVPEMADVTVVGEYQPSAYSFKSDEHWDEKNMKVADFK